jgi:hypothetical protein
MCPRRYGFNSLSHMVLRRHQPLVLGHVGCSLLRERDAANRQPELLQSTRPENELAFFGDTAKVRFFGIEWCYAKWVG